MRRTAQFLFAWTVVLAAACGPAAAPVPTTAPAAKPAAGARGQGAQLKVLYWQAPTILNTHLSQGTKDYDAGRLVLEPLLAINGAGDAVAVLAAEVPSV